MTRPDPHLTAIPQWLPVLLVPMADGRTKKLPLHPVTLVPTDPHDPTAWTTYDAACATAASGGPQMTVGFVITAADDLFCVDLDGALQPDGQWSALATALVAGLPGCFVEVSQSGRGLHIWGRYANPPAHRSKRVDLHIELYSSRRFIAIGTPLSGSIAPRCDALPSLIAQVFPPVASASHAATPDTGPSPEWRGPTDDEDLLRRALRSRSVAAQFDGRPSFGDLWTADADVLGRAYPADASSSEPFDRSSADAALASHLAFWTGRDVARMERLMRRSALARPKWDDRVDYLVERTIRGACGVQSRVLQDKPVQETPLPVPGPTPAVPGDALAPAAAAAAAADPLIPLPLTATRTLSMKAVQGSTFLSPADQATMFDGYCYVVEPHQVLCPGGRLLGPDRFKSMFGGFTFSMDLRNERTTRHAFEAFTESQALRAPRADNICFKPRLPFGAIVNVGHRRLVNTFWPANVKRVAGDCAPMLRHLELMVPDKFERDVTFYMQCAIVQHPGYKAQWAVVMQGAQGNGKTLLARLLAFAVGKEYTYWVRADKVTKEFNAWLLSHLLYIVEEIKIGDREDFMDIMKTMITAIDGIEIERKGVDQMNADICGNFWFSTNHKDALKLTKNDRRFLMVKCHQQTAEDLTRDGMTPDYMQALHEWADNGGFDAWAHLLATTTVPAEFDFTRGLQRAPQTESMRQTFATTLGAVEQEIMDAVEREETGFRGDWISSKYLDELLRRSGKDRVLPLNRRKDVLDTLGYIWHPALRDGRVNNSVEPDGMKSKLFVRRDSPTSLIEMGADAAMAYTRANSAFMAAPQPMGTRG